MKGFVGNGKHNTTEITLSLRAGGSGLRLSFQFTPNNQTCQPWKESGPGHADWCTRWYIGEWKETGSYYLLQGSGFTKP